MINLDGNLYTDLSKLPKDYHRFFSLPFQLKEVIRFEKGRPLFWELHYFRLMAAMRRMRYLIPNTFTMDFLQDEIQKTVNENHNNSEAALVTFTVLQENGNLETGTHSLCFLIETEGVEALKDIKPQHQFSIDLYKDAFILPGLLSNLTLINAPLRRMIEVYANENGLNDCFVLNDKKNLVETTLGTPYLIKDNELITPDLMSGSQNLPLRSAFNTWLKSQSSVLKLQERTITPFELQNANEILIISLQYGGVGVTNYRKTTYNTIKGQELFNAFITSST